MKRRLGLFLALVALLIAASGECVQSREEVSREALAEAAGIVGDIRVDDLPRQARETLALIRQGGPFPFRKDGSVFQNRERRLPLRARGYYTEYTVRTRWERDRGARRIVADKGASGDPASSGEYYYTDDHYETFRRIVLAPAGSRLR